MNPLDLSRSYSALGSIAELKENWNKEGAKPFSETLINRVGRILPTLNRVPKISPTGRNSIQLEYTRIIAPVSEDYIAFEFFENGDLKLFKLFDWGKEEIRYILDNEVNAEVELFYQNNSIKKEEHKTMTDYKTRFIKEYNELKIKYTKLHDMVVKYDAKTLDFTPTCPIDLLKEQLAAMGKYLYILEVRAQIEKIDLSESEEKNIMGGCIYSYPLADKYFSTTDSAPMEMKFLNEEEQKQMDSQIHKISKISKEKYF